MGNPTAWGTRMDFEEDIELGYEEDPRGTESPETESLELVAEPNAADAQRFFLSEEMYEGDGFEGLYPRNEFFNDLLTVVKAAAKKGIGFYISRKPSAQKTSVNLNLTNSEGTSTDSLNQVDLAALRTGKMTVKEEVHQLIGGINAREDLMRYFLVSSACYVEIPRSRYIGGNKVQSYDKWLCTSSEPVVARWLGVSLDEARGMLKGKLVDAGAPDLIRDSAIPWVKLEMDKDGVRKIVKSRNLLKLDTDGIRVTPFALLKGYLDTAIEKCNDGYAEFVYLKDNGQVRRLITTLNYQTLEEVYTSTYARATIMGSYNPEEENLKTLSRGYVRVPEVGLPENEDCVRALNFNRILGIKYNVEPDLRFVKVDLKNVTQQVSSRIEGTNPTLAVDLITNLINEGVLDKGFWQEVKKTDEGTKVTWKKDPNIFNLMDNLMFMDTLMGTEFRKKLHTWTQGVGGQLFVPGYTGKIDTQVSTFSSGMTSLDGFSEGILEDNSKSVVSTLPDTEDLDIELDW